MKQHPVEINDQHLMDRLQEIVPQLRKELEASMRSRHQMELQRLKEEKRQELARKYETMIRQRVEESNSSIKNSLATMAQIIDNYKLTQRHKARPLTPQEEHDFVEQTVQEILADQNMVEQVRNRMRGRVQARVRSQLQREIDDEVDMAKRQVTQRLKEEREMWAEERIAYWKQQSNRQLEDLASQRNQLSSKKQVIEASLAAKRAQKTQLQMRLGMITQKNAMVSHLRRELKELKQKMRV